MKKLFNKDQSVIDKIQLILNKFNQLKDSQCDILYDKLESKYFPFISLNVKKSDLSHITNKTGFLKGNSSINHTSIKFDDFRFSSDNIVIEGKTKDYFDSSGEDTEATNSNKNNKKVKVANFCCGLFS